MKNWKTVGCVILLLLPGSVVRARSQGDLRAPAQVLVTDSPIERELASGQTHRFYLTLATGQFFKLKIERHGVTALVVVSGPDEQQWVELPSDPDPFGAEQIALIAATGGRHQIEIRATGKSAPPGRYQLLVSDLRAATEADRHLVAGAAAFAEGERLYNQRTAEARRLAIAQYQQALPHWRAVREREREGETLRQIAMTWRLLGEARQALEPFQQARALAQALGNGANEVMALNGLCLSYSSLGELPRALDSCQQALPLSRALSDRIYEALTLDNLATVNRSLGAPRQALDYFNQALAVYRAVGNRSSEALALGNLGAVYAELGEPFKALEYHQQALALHRELGVRDRQVMPLQNIAQIRHDLGDFQQALDHYQQALTLVSAGGNRRFEARVLANLGRTYLTLGEAQQAAEHFNRALQISREIGDRDQQAVVLRFLGLAHQRRGQWAEAAEQMRQALALHRALGNRESEIEDLIGLGVSYAETGEPQRALDCYRQALPVSRELGVPRLEGAALFQLGRTARVLGDSAAAEYLQQAFALSVAISDTGLQAEVRHELARVALAQHNPRAAQTQIEAAIQLVETARARLAGQEWRAGYRGTVQRFYETWLETLLRQHQAQPAGGFEALALQASEHARARSLLEMLSEAKVEMHQGVTPELLKLERETGQRLAAKAERLTLLRPNPNNQATTELSATLQAEIITLTGEYQSAQARIRTASPAYAALTQPPSLTLAELQRQALDPQTLLLEYSLGEEQSYLFAVTATELHSFALPKRAEIERLARPVYERLTLHGRPAVFKTIAEKQAWLAQAERAYGQAAAALSQTLLAPVAKLLGQKRLLIVGDGILNYLPFGALPAPAMERRGERETGRGGAGQKGFNPTSRPVAPSPRRPLVPLIVNHEIVSLPSASTLVMLRRELAGRPLAPKTLALLADPVFAANDERVHATGTPLAQNINTSSEVEVRRAFRAVTDSEITEMEANTSILRLPFTRREAEAISALVPAAERKVALDFDATLATATNAELGQYRYVHFATHGLLNNEQAQLSGLVLSLVDPTGAPQHGFLRALDVYQLKLPAELVVLSGCRTGLGKEVRGEGLQGLTRGFMYAGARRVVASLWEVSDVATAELMRRFYAGLLSQKPGAKRLAPAAALRAAQVSLWREGRWRLPYYWAAFVMQGEW
ncbi:MAG: CHAT domain-containing protein [Acidobacteria bacterium]|nr:CHAT domain-containing protein [Acidobacteriota bacterium]